MSRILERLNLIDGRDSKKTMRPLKPNQNLFFLVLNSFLDELKRLLKKAF